MRTIPSSSGKSTKSYSKPSARSSSPDFTRARLMSGSASVSESSTPGWRRRNSPIAAGMSVA